MTVAYGIRVVGHRAAGRRSVDWRTAFAAYCSCDHRAQPERESFLSHFTYGAEFHRQLKETGSEAGYSGPCGADWIHWDIDRAGDLASAVASMSKDLQEHPEMGVNAYMLRLGMMYYDQGNPAAIRRWIEGFR